MIKSEKNFNSSSVAHQFKYFVALSLNNFQYCNRIILHNAENFLNILESIFTFILSWVSCCSSKYVNYA